MNFTVAILSKPPNPKTGDLGRQTSLLEMLHALDIEKRNPKPPAPPKIRGMVFQDARPEEMPWAEFKTHLAQKQWEWSLAQGAEFGFHVFLTDDLNVYPMFWEVLEAMLEGAGRPAAVGLLSNHPRGPALYRAGVHAYRTNSWLVGPAYVLSTRFLAESLAAYRALPEMGEKSRQWFNDDSWLNEWNTFQGPKEAWHPLPTIIEHRFDVPSTVGHGDRYSRERVSWREERRVVDDGETGFQWASRPLYPYPHEQERLADLMLRPSFWSGEAPMLAVGEASK